MPVIINGSTGISGTDGSAGTPALQGTDTNTGMYFPAADQIAFAEGGVEAMRLDASGNLGLGTTTPGNKLTVAASTTSQIRVISAAGGTEYYDFGRDNADGLFAFNGAQTTFVGYKWLINGTERARINSNGRFLVNTTSEIDVGRVSIQYSSANSIGIGIQQTNSGSGTLMNFLNSGGTSVGNIGTNGTTTAYTTTSDYRLKEDVAPLTGGLATIAALKPSTYRWNTDNTYGEGFIAHELAEHIPLAVSGEKDAITTDGSIKPQGVDYSKIVVHLVAAVQELKAENDALKARVAALEAR